ncbi:cell division regulator GpsB [Weissella ceti]|uniref:Cell division regulator GpsB n=1 Tax=Weissella ceti TaxID=759620 RepID=A0ABT3E4C3_9LACO|nr:cell division regulator GpsB [Weissella ceti]MCW0953286.1 cell division regulator GpsB [Weissella ceti]QVK11395.1 cell division regulator GpsB [Weissella ceti]
MENVLHTREQILRKDFKKTRIGTGYEMADVDSFLDEIMADYQAFQNNMDQLEAQNASLKSQVAELTKQLSAAQMAEPTPAAPTKVAQPTVAANTNMDILKRLSNLERRVFGVSSESTKNTDASAPVTKIVSEDTTKTLN